MIITNLIGQNQAEQAQEAAQDAAQVQQQLQVYGYALRDPNTPGALKQAAKQQLLGLVAKHGGPEAKKNLPQLGDYLTQIAGVSSRMAGASQSTAAMGAPSTGFGILPSMAGMESGGQTQAAPLPPTSAETAPAAGIPSAQPAAPTPAPSQPTAPTPAPSGLIPRFATMAGLPQQAPPPHGFVKRLLHGLTVAGEAMGGTPTPQRQIQAEIQRDRARLGMIREQLVGAADRGEITQQQAAAAWARAIGGGASSDPVETYRQEKQIDIQAQAQEQQNRINWILTNREKLKRDYHFTDQQIDQMITQAMVPSGVKFPTAASSKTTPYKAVSSTGETKDVIVDSSGNVLWDGQWINVEDLPEGWKLGGKIGTYSPKTDEVDKIAGYLIKSGQAKNTEEATQKANEIALSKVQARTGGPPLTKEQLHATAEYDLLNGHTTSFGFGASANRTAYQAERANIIMERGPHSVAEKAAEQKADVTSLVNLQKMADVVDSWEENTRKNLDQVLKLSSQYGRSGSTLANDYLQWTQGKLEEYPLLAKFRVAVETAVADYTKAMYATTAAGGTAQDQRDATHNLLKTAMGDNTVQGAVEQMNTDLDNRHNSLQDQLGKVKDRQRTRGGGEGDGLNPPPPPDSKDPLGILK